MPETLHLRGDRPEDIARAAAMLRSDGLVAFPTETVYGLGANALSARAVGRIFTAKQRPAWDPLIVHLPSFEGVSALVQLTANEGERVRLLADRFWPGPLTLLLPRSLKIPDEVTAGRAKVGVRVPAHPFALALLRAAGVPVAAPSANRFGHTSPTTAQHVLDDLDGRIDAVLDGGPTRVGLESTVLDPLATPMIVYRAGAVTGEMLERATGVPVAAYIERGNHRSEPAALPSPGVGMRHYAPETRLVLSEPNCRALEEQIRRVQESAEIIGVLLPRDWELRDATFLELQPWGIWNNPASLAAELFAGLRNLEARGVSAIVCPLPAPGGIREALRDRLTKAARVQ